MPAEGNLPVVAMETDKGKIVLELYKNDAPGTVDNFMKLAHWEFAGARYASAQRTGT